MSTYAVIASLLNAATSAGLNAATAAVISKLNGSLGYRLLAQVDHEIQADGGPHRQEIFRALRTTVIIKPKWRIVKPITGAATVVVAMGTTGLGAELMNAQTIDATFTTEDFFGLAMADYGPALPAAQDYSAGYQAGDKVYLSSVPSAPIPTGARLRAYIYGIELL